MDGTDTLKLRGYRVDDEHGHIVCHVPSDDAPRFVATHCTLIAIDVTSGDARHIVDSLVEAAGAAIVGRKRGGVVLLYKGSTIIDRVEDLATRDGKVRFTVSCGSEGRTLDPRDYTWATGKSPLDIARDQLPTYTDDLPQLVLNAADRLGCDPWTVIEQRRKDAQYSAKLRERMGRGELRILTREEQVEAEDERLVRDHADRVIGGFPDSFELLVLAARNRRAMRLAAKNAPATEAAEDRRYRFMTGEGSP